MIIKPITITMKIVTKKVNFRARIVTGFLTKNRKPIDVREVRCVYVQGVWL